LFFEERQFLEGSFWTSVTGAAQSTPTRVNLTRST